MSNEIVNRVANSALITIDLDKFYPKGKHIEIDISIWLFQGLVVREKEFRASLKEHDWSQYQDTFVSIICSTDAIIPGWANLLITTYLQPYAKLISIGSKKDLDLIYFTQQIESLDLSIYQDKPVIINGCNDCDIPDSAFVLLVQKLMPVARSIMYGEACSSVPLYKNNLKK